MTEQANDSPRPANWIRGVGVVAVAVVVGIVLMPSATRPPLALSNASQTTPTLTVPPSVTTTTTAGRTPTSAARSTTTTAAPTVLPGASAVHVLVANGTSITGLAGGVASYLRTRGFGTLSAANATTRVSATQIYAAAGQSHAAALVVSCGPIRRALGHLLQERLCFSHDAQSCFGPAQTTLGQVQLPA